MMSLLKKAIVDLPWPIRLEGNSRLISGTEFVESAGAQNKDIIAASQTFYQPVLENLRRKLLWSSFSHSSAVHCISRYEALEKVKERHSSKVAPVPAWREDWRNRPLPSSKNPTSKMRLGAQPF